MPKTSPSNEAVAISSPHHLSQEDVLRLLNPEQATEARLDVTDKLTEQYESASISEEEAIIAEQVFRLLVRDTEIEVRKTLADKLKKSAQLPRDIALTMASDVAEIALPILEHSKVLTDLDLADLIEATPDVQRHVAIARRENVSEQVVEALLEHTDEVTVAETLAGNDGAKMNTHSVELLVQRHFRLPQVMEILAVRPNLPVTVREKVIAHVSDTLKEQLSGHDDAVRDIVHKEANQSRLQATLDLISDDLNEQDMRKLIEQLIGFGRLTPSLLLAAIARGYISFFVVTIATKANIPVENALKLMRDRGGLGFRALYNKCDLPPDYFPILRDIIPTAIELKEEMSGLEEAGFAKLLTKRLIQQCKESEKSSDHVVTAIKQVME